MGTLDETDRIMNDTFWIGVYPGTSDEIIDRIIGEKRKLLFDREKNAKLEAWLKEK
jgi:CDP-6-deoxy-D-xylo-4-hexulose-3-dehydrase